MEKNDKTLKDINLELKESGKAPFFYRESNYQKSADIHVKFFIINRGSPPSFLFEALLYTIPAKGDIFSIENDIYIVKNATRNLMFSGTNKTRETSVSILVSKKFTRDQEFSDNRKHSNRQYENQSTNQTDRVPFQRRYK